MKVLIIMGLIAVTPALVGYTYWKVRTRWSLREGKRDQTLENIRRLERELGLELEEPAAPTLYPGNSGDPPRGLKVATDENDHGAIPILKTINELRQVEQEEPYRVQKVHPDSLRAYIDQGLLKEEILICGYCKGSGRLHDWTPEPPCRACSGSGVQRRIAKPKVG